uniref:Replication protein A OB domain-containing protein n=1 Tax=Populus trichocarpa TaxID=3694 RepID=A0A2K1ZKM8_POPTR
MALPIKKIKKYNFYPSLRARACRVWIAKFNGQPSSFNCIFVDNQGGVIQALAKTRDLPTFAAIIIEGNHYEIKGFYIYENRAVNTVVVHDVVIDLKSNTKIAGIEAITPYIPRCYFNFIDYAHILTKSKGSRILTDVLGRLKALQPLKQVMVRGQTLENKREFMFENIRGEELRITLWGDNARDFDELALHNLPSPIIIAFAGFRVTEFKGKPNLNSTVVSLWYFNPDMPECLAYKHFFAQLPVEIQQLPSSSNVVFSIEEQIKENRRTIHEILYMNPYEHKHLRFTCQALIVDFDFPNGWWYPSCPKCNKKLNGGENNYTCMDHDAITSLPVPWFRLECIITDGEDVTNFLLFGKTAENVFGSSAHHYVYDKKFIDPSVIPLAMTAKLNKNMIFQLRFGAFRSTTNICEIIITNIFDNTTNKSIHPLETPTTKVKSSTTSKTSTLLSSMKQVLIAPSTP